MQVVNIRRLGYRVLTSYDGDQHALSWSHADALYLAAKRLLKDAAEYDASGHWTESLPSEAIDGLRVMRMGLMMQLLRHGRLWIEAPYEQMRQILKALYRLAKEIEADDPPVALAQIDDMAVLYVSAAPLGLSRDRRKIDEALKQTSSGVPPCGIVPPPCLIGGAP